MYTSLPAACHPYGMHARTRSPLNSLSKLSITHSQTQKAQGAHTRPKTGHEERTNSANTSSGTSQHTSLVHHTSLRLSTPHARAWACRPTLRRPGASLPPSRCAAIAPLLLLLLSLLAPEAVAAARLLRGDDAAQLRHALLQHARAVHDHCGAAGQGTPPPGLLQSWVRTLQQCRTRPAPQGTPPPPPPCLATHHSRTRARAPSPRAPCSCAAQTRRGPRCAAPPAAPPGCARSRPPQTP